MLLQQYMQDEISLSVLTISVNDYLGRNNNYSGKTLEPTVLEFDNQYCNKVTMNSAYNAVRMQLLCLN